MCDRCDIEAAGLADASMDVCRIAKALHAHHSRAEHLHKALVFACNDNTPERPILAPLERYREAMAQSRQEDGE